MSRFHSSPNKYVDQIVLKVKNLEASIEFYSKILGFKHIEKNGRKATISANGKDPLIILEQPRKVKDKELRRTGLYHFALLLPNRKELGKFFKYIKDIGYSLMGASHHGISEAIYLQDIDDNGIEIYADTPVNRWKWKDDSLEMITTRLDLQSLLDEGKDEDWEAMPEETIIGHIHLHVSDLEEAESFYVDGLGFDIVNKIPNQATFTSTGGYHHHIAFNIWNGKGIPAPDEDSVGLKYFRIKFPDEESRKATIDKLKELGYEVKVEADNIITFDPSHNKIHLVL